jgi:hypothetical protein
LSKATKAMTAAASGDERKPCRAIDSATFEDGRLDVAGTSEQKAALSDIMGSESPDFQNYIIEHTLRALALIKQGGDITAGLNTGLAIINAVAPTNELEAVLAAQMVGANHFAMLSWARATNQTDMAVVQAHAAMANKASRTFAMQMEALAKMRRGGEQVVRHVHVNEGGQAVIAGTVHTGRGSEK